MHPLSRQSRGMETMQKKGFTPGWTRTPTQQGAGSDWFCPFLSLLTHTAPIPFPQFQSLQLEREMCLASNCTQAKVNLSLRPRLEDGKASLAIKYQELQEIREACWDKQQRLETYLEKWSPQSALGQLQAKLDASEAESEEQIKQFLTQELPLESFLESFCQSRTRSHICRTQLEKLQELLQKEQSAVAPKAFDLSHGFVPAFLLPSEAAVPFPVPAAPPKHHLPALAQQPASPSSEIPSLGSPLRLVGHIPLLSPQPGHRQSAPRALQHPRPVQEALGRPRQPHGPAELATTPLRVGTLGILREAAKPAGTIEDLPAARFDPFLSKE
ncbi:PREDICTED: vacuolar protein sorting-associated protein 37D [Ficedula albicollis]|uniref:vacuolar protein sorting-associated protein 37D n=1 Tax=Ficedula albicollis TaxID=59894 RepID=UPI0007AD8CE6|nr:PREDICTED: vacuolar protein sorting-associated protein 37D [Ficedula albicollis]